MLTEANAAFIQRFTSMSVAARDAQNRPFVGRALGCRVSADRRKLTIFLSASRALQVLECLRLNGALALAVTRPTTHETLQLKGTVLDIGPPSSDDWTEIAAYRESFVQELASVGYRPDFSREVLAGSEDSVAVVFEPLTMFNQTPGPKAGTRLEGRQ
jgi:hypothetical protein